MKFCTNCTHSTKEVVGGQQGYATVYVCHHPECLHPVDASLLPCEAVRKQDIFCGFSAKYYSEKVQEPAKEETKGSVIVTK